MLTIDSAIVSS